MATRIRLVIVAGSIVVTFATLWLALALAGASAVIASPAITPTATTEPPVFTATLSVLLERQQLSVGDTLTVTTNIVVSQGCQYPAFELTLDQTLGEDPIFAHINPPTGIITGPLPGSIIWTFLATQPGTATFSARSFGERYCGDFWNFQYLYGKSEAVTVNPTTFEVWLPGIVR